MSQAKCFNCGEILEAIGRPMEELIEAKLPTFCGMECAGEFPIEEDEIKERFKQLLKECAEEEFLEKLQQELDFQNIGLHNNLRFMIKKRLEKLR